eukprot:TRINITY_DN508_c0_g1_i1.p1 TRINITY_DN508_c0_g1~~TRINITY_DN508_c0_g1_i1.p1  ORF type:complete len:654 (-),score=184.73 TRINITY_DN508_c0_g1_i1:766-2670(-)
MSDNKDDKPKWDLESFNLFFGIYRIPRIEADASLMLPLYEFPKLPKAIKNRPKPMEIYPTAAQHLIIHEIVKGVLSFYNRFFSMIDDDESIDEKKINQPTRAVFRHFQIVYLVKPFEHIRNNKNDTPENIISLLILQPTISKKSAISSFNRFYNTFNFLTGGLDQIYRYANKTPEFVHKYLSVPHFSVVHELMRMSMTRIFLENLVIGISVVYPTFMPYFEWCLPLLNESESFLKNLKKRFSQFLCGIIYFEDHILFYDMNNQLLALCDSLYKTQKFIQNENHLRVFIDDNISGQRINVFKQTPEYASIFQNFHPEHENIPAKADHRSVEEIVGDNNFHGTWVDYHVIKQGKIEMVLLIIDEYNKGKSNFEENVRNGLLNVEQMLNHALEITKEQLQVDLYEEFINYHSFERQNDESVHLQDSKIMDLLVHKTSKAIATNICTLKNQNFFMKELLTQFCKKDCISDDFDILTIFNEGSVENALNQLSLNQFLCKPYEKEFLQRTENNCNTADLITFLKTNVSLNEQIPLKNKDIFTDLSRFTTLNESFGLDFTHNKDFLANIDDLENNDIHTNSSTQVITGDNNSIIISNFGNSIESHIQFQNFNSNTLNIEDIDDFEANVKNHLFHKHLLCVK